VRASLGAKAPASFVAVDPDGVRSSSISTSEVDGAIRKRAPFGGGAFL